MSTQKAIDSNSVKNSGGSVLNGGTNYEFKPVITSRRNSSSVNVGVFGSTVIDSTNGSVPQVTTSVESSPFATLNKVVGMKISNTNVYDILLKGAASEKGSTSINGSNVSGVTKRKSINRMEAVRTTLWSTAFRANKFSLYTGKFVAGFPQVSNDDAMVVSGGTYQDEAADPTRSVPGRLSFKSGAKNPVVSNYSRKTG